eukprot:2060902-Rhodomonas_salina.1
MQEETQVRAGCEEGESRKWRDCFGCPSEGNSPDNAARVPFKYEASARGEAQPQHQAEEGGSSGDGAGACCCRHQY